MKIILELFFFNDIWTRVIYTAISDMFNVDLEIEGCDIELSGHDKDVAAWIAFHTFPTEMIEA